MTTETNLVSQVTSLANVQSSEGFSQSDLVGYIQGALRQHNKRLTAATLPVEEEELVVTLAWIKILIVRAGRYAMQPNVSGASGYGQDRGTPYQKCMDMAAKLMIRYKELVEDLNLVSLGDKGISVGNILVKDLTFDALVPWVANPNIPLLNVYEVETDLENTAVIKWDFDPYDNFRLFHFFHLVGDDPIYVEWNYDSSSGVPKINDNAIKIATIHDIRKTALKITGIDKPSVNRILMVVMSRSHNYGYSNELILSNVVGGHATISGPEGEMSGPEGRIVL